MTTSVIIPSLNEAESIKSVIDEIPRELVNEIIVVDGNSNDGTEKIVMTIPDVTLINQKSVGFGSAIREGIKRATGDVIIILNADGSHNPSEIKGLLDKIDQGFDYVMAERYSKNAHSEDDTVLRRFGNKIITGIINILYHKSISDSLYLFTAIRKSKLDAILLNKDGFEFCVEVIIKAIKNDLKMAEVPSHERKRIAGKSKVRPFWHGLIIIIEIFRSLKY